MNENTRKLIENLCEVWGDSPDMAGIKDQSVRQYLLYTWPELYNAIYDLVVIDNSWTDIN